MTARTRSRNWFFGAAAAALLAPVALVVAAAAPANATGQFHEVYMYKVEKHVDISGDFPDKNMHEHVYCNAGDWALDGMWRVDNVEQANPPETFGDERDVYFSASYGDDVDRTEWHFRATNYADGTAQIKLFATCIRQDTDNQHLHTHPIRVSPRRNYVVGPVGVHNTPPADWYDVDHNFQCAPDEYAVAPGFNFAQLPDPREPRTRIVRSWPSPDFRSWHWSFVVEEPANLTLYLRCLRTTVGEANGHSHLLPMTWRPDGNGSLRNLTFIKTQEVRLNCDDGPDGAAFQLYKAMVGAFWIYDPFHTWFLGMDPRPKQRSYKFWWDGGGDNRVWLAALCIRARTGKQIAPVP